MVCVTLISRPGWSPCEGRGRLKQRCVEWASPMNDNLDPR